jgi:hypothetical protein
LKGAGPGLNLYFSRFNFHLELGRAQALFKTRTPGCAQILGTYDVAADGQRFLIGELVGEPVPAPIVILNWPAVLKR